MIRTLLVAAAVLCALASSAEARHKRHHHRHHVSATAKPHAWCGWFGRFDFLRRDPGPRFNLARNWASIGSNAGGPAVGAIVVWPHHVGKIVGRASNGQWIVRSGNDGNRVRTRPRSVAGAIAFRWP